MTDPQPLFPRVAPAPRIPGDIASTYQELREQVLTQLGAEFTSKQMDDHRRLQKHRVVLKDLNERLELQLNEKQIELMALVYVSLSYANRFSGTEGFEEEGIGETPVKHSMHAALDAWRDISATMATPPSVEEVARRKTIVLGLLMHDADEVFGEPTTVHSRAASGAQEQDASQGVKVLHYAMRLAADAMNKKQGDTNAYQALFAKFRQIRDMADVKQVGYDNILAQIKKEQLPALSSEHQQIIDPLISHYALAENVLESLPALSIKPAAFGENTSFLRGLIKLYDRSEGSAHYTKFNRKIGDGFSGISRLKNWQELYSQASQETLETSTPNRQAARYLTGTSLQIDSCSMMANLAYSESSIVGMLRAAKTDEEKQVAQCAASHAITRIIQSLCHGSHYLDRMPEKRTGPFSLQRGFTNDQNRLCTERQAEMIAQREERKSFDGVRNYLPRYADKRELISAYQQLRDKIQGGWVPSVVTTYNDGKPSEYRGLLIQYPPEVPLPSDVNLNKPIRLEAGVNPDALPVKVIVSR